MARIVTTHYRYKRPPRKRKAGTLQVPAIVTRAKKSRRPEVEENQAAASRSQPEHSTPADVRRDSPVTTAEKASAIVTARRRKHAMHAHLFADMTSEEHKRRGDAADALWRELVRRVHENRS